MKTLAMNLASCKVNTYRNHVISLFFFMAFMLVWPLQAQDMPKTVTIDNDPENLNLNKESEKLPLLRIDGEENKADNKFDFSKKPGIEFVPKEKFATRGKAIEKKLNKKEGEDIEEGYKSNQYLGDFKSNAKFVKVICRDHEFVDGDRVKVYVNDEVIQHDILLSDRFYGFAIDLERGFNKIDFQALNQGSSGPNTAEFQVYDDQGQLVSSNRWMLATGVKATLIIVKE